MIVNVKLNNLIWMITGRSDGFVYPLLNTYINVMPANDARVTLARSVLKLDVLGTDFYTYGALAALYSSLYFVRDLDVQHQAAFVPGVMPLTVRSADVYQRDASGQIVYVGEVPQPTAESNLWTVLPFYNETSISTIRNVMQWDTPYDALRLTYHSVGGTVDVTKYWLGTAGSSRTFPVTVVASGIIELDALEFAGLRGQFAVNSEDVSDLPVAPVIYPYSVVRQRIIMERPLIELMHDTGTIEAFHEATSDMAAVGALVASIVRKAREASTGPSYEVQLAAPADTGIPQELQVPVKFGAVAATTPCHE